MEDVHDVRLSGNALVPSEPLYTELVCRRRQPPPFPHLARAESPYVVLSFPGGRAEHESVELFLQPSLQSKVISVMKEKCSEAREWGSGRQASGNVKDSADIGHGDMRMLLLGNILDLSPEAVTKILQRMPK